MTHAICRESVTLRIYVIRNTQPPGNTPETDAQPGAQPEGPVRGFNLSIVGAARRLANRLGVMTAPRMFQTQHGRATLAGHPTGRKR